LNDVYRIGATGHFDALCQETVPMAIRCFVESVDFEDAIRLSVMAGGDAALSWATTVEFLLYEVEIDVDASRHTVDDASYCSTVTLAKGGQCE